MDRRTALKAMAGAAAFGGRAAQARPKPRIPILAWYGPPPAETTVERYRELAECGFTENYSGQPNADAIVHSLDVAGAAGIRQYVSLPKTDPEVVVRRIKDHPALGGYFLRDEPSAGDFGRLAEWARRVQVVDSTHPCYINLLPTYATPAQLGTPTYPEYVDRFLAQVPVPLLTFDHYPVIANGLRPDWYQNLEIVSQAARKSGKPFWAFALAVAHGPYPIPTVEQLRLQVFSDLAYGAQCIQYFTYWTPDSTEWNFHQAPIDGGKRTPVYDRVRQVNGEIQALAHVFSGARVQRVEHTGSLPQGTRSFRAEPPVAGMVTGGDGALVSRLSNGKRRYLVIVNRSYRTPMPLAVRFDGSATVREERREGSASRVDAQFEREVSPGDVVILSWGG